MLHWQTCMRQRFVRHSVQIPLIYKRLDKAEPCQAGTGWVEDLGEGGARLKLPCPLLRGCHLGIVIFSEPEVVEVEARVVWVRAGGQRTFYYHGVEFIYISPPYYHSLLKALAQTKSSEQRTYRRFSLTPPVSCRVETVNGPSLEGQMRDISRGGALIALREQCLPHTEVEITLHTPRIDRMPGTVQWASDSADDAGLFPHGIEFLHELLEAHTFLSLFGSAHSEETPVALTPKG